MIKRFQKNGGGNPLATIKDFWQQVLESNEPKFVLLRLILAGVFIRLCVMPFFCHPDFLSEFRRIHFQFQEFNFFPGARFLVTAVETLNYAIAYPFLSDAGSLFYLAPNESATAGHGDFFAFVSHSSVFKALFMLKMSYLIFDMLSAWMIFRYTLSGFGLKKAWTATAVWIFNPVTIFSFYIFGRYESIALFFFLLALLFIKRHRILPACAAFSACLWSREIFALTLPLFVIAVWIFPRTSWLKKLTGTIFIVLTLGFVSNLLPSILGFESALKGTYGSMVAQDQIRSVIAFNIKWYYPIIVIYTLLAFYLICSESPLEERLNKALLGFFLSFFAFSVHSVHYVAWLFPILCLMVPVSRHMIIGIIGFVMSWIAYWLLATDLGVFTAWLAAPVSTHMLNLPNLPILLGELMPKFTSLRVPELISIVKSVNIACLIFFAVLVFRKPKNKAEKGAMA